MRMHERVVVPVNDWKLIIIISKKSCEMITTSFFFLFAKPQCLTPNNPISDVSTVAIVRYMPNSSARRDPGPIECCLDETAEKMSVEETCLRSRKPRLGT